MSQILNPAGEIVSEAVVLKTYFELAPEQTIAEFMAELDSEGVIYTLGTI